MKYFHLLFLIITFIFAALQWNDIDGLIWMCIYLATSLLALLTYKNICLSCTIAWAVLITIFASLLLIAVSPGIVNFIEVNAYTEIFFGMSDEKPYIERTREALGLLIVLIYSVSILTHAYLTRKH